MSSIAVELPSIDVPSPPAWPLIGHLPELATQQLDWVARTQGRLGDVFAARAGPQRIVMLSHPDHVRHVLVERRDVYTKGGTFWSAVRSLIGLGLPTSEGQTWRSRRRMMNPEFRRTRVAQMGDAMARTLADQFATWPAQPAAFDVARGVSRAAMAVIVQTMFGTGLTPEQSDEVGDALSFSLDHMLHKVVTDALPAWLPVPGRRAHQRAVARIDAVLYDLIAQRRAEGPSDDLLSMLLEMRDTDGSGLDDEALRDETMSLFLAGYETTAASVSWGIARLAADPTLYAPLVEEVDGVLGDRAPTAADVPALQATTRFFFETLRLDGPVYWLPRTAAQDDVIDGFRIEEGTMVALMLDRIHRHPSAWVEPDRFDPDRFLPERHAGRSPTAWIPFGAGQRQCIGKGFAVMEGTFLLAMLVQRFRFELLDDTRLVPQIGLTRRPRYGVKVRVVPRR
ncbi:MAG: cytochrome P450 [Myxococcales bacterium]|nr:cytochrome P450 [Myxococcales bacterium]